MKALRLKTFLTLFLGGLLFASCLKDDLNNDYPQAVFFMVNGYTAAPAVVFSADANYLQSANYPLEYRSYTYSNLFPGNRRIRSQSLNQGTSEVILDTTYTFRDSTLYTSFLFGTAAPQTIITTDKPINNLNGKSAIRFLHLAANTDAVNVFLDDKQIVEQRQNEGIRDQQDAPQYLFDNQESAGKHTIIIENTQGEKLIEREFDFQANRHYSIILIGDKESTQTPLYIGVVLQY